MNFNSRSLRGCSSSRRDGRDIAIIEVHLNFVAVSRRSELTYSQFVFTCQAPSVHVDQARWETRILTPFFAAISPRSTLQRELFFAFLLLPLIPAKMASSEPSRSQPNRSSAMDEYKQVRLSTAAIRAANHLVPARLGDEESTAQAELGGPEHGVSESTAWQDLCRSCGGGHCGPCETGMASRRGQTLTNGPGPGRRRRT